MDDPDLDVPDLDVPNLARSQAWAIPPSTVISAPVVKLDALEARKRIVSATSSGRPQRRIGIRPSNRR